MTRVDVFTRRHRSSDLGWIAVRARAWRACARAVRCRSRGAGGGRHAARPARRRALSPRRAMAAALPRTIGAWLPRPPAPPAGEAAGGGADGRSARADDGSADALAAAVAAARDAWDGVGGRGLDGQAGALREREARRALAAERARPRYPLRRRALGVTRVARCAANGWQSRALTSAPAGVHSNARACAPDG